jgi:hypothetical protein
MAALITVTKEPMTTAVPIVWALLALGAVAPCARWRAERALSTVRSETPTSLAA